MDEKSRQRTVHIVCSFFKKEEMEGEEKWEEKKSKLASYTYIDISVKTDKYITAFD